MPKVDVPFTDESVDTSQPLDSVMSLAMLIVGAGVFFMVMSYGRSVGSWLTSLTDNLLGTNASGSNDPMLGGVD
jgi:hypothetical protein